jgi:hypothetical protein
MSDDDNNLGILAEGMSEEELTEYGTQLFASEMSYHVRWNLLKVITNIVGTTGGIRDNGLFNANWRDLEARLQMRLTVDGSVVDMASPCCVCSIMHVLDWMLTVFIIRTQALDIGKCWLKRRLLAMCLSQVAVRTAYHLQLAQ